LEKVIKPLSSFILHIRRREIHRGRQRAVDDASAEDRARCVHVQICPPHGLALWDLVSHFWSGKMGAASIAYHARYDAS
jgi:hypothetical protein